MIEAFVLVRVRPGTEIIVRDELNELAKDNEVYMLYGEWDFIVRVESKNLSSLRNFIIENIRNIDGVIETKTLIVADNLEE